MPDHVPHIRRLRPLALMAIVAVIFAAGCSQCGVEDEEEEEVQGLSFEFDDVQTVHIESALGFPPLEIDAERLRASREEFYEVPDLERLEGISDANVDGFREAFRTLNEAQFAGDDVPPEEELKMASAKYRHQIRTIITPIGKRAFVPLGEAIFDECNQGLEHLLDAVQDEELTMEQAIESPPLESFEAYRQNCGNLLAYLKERDLVDDSGQWTRDDAPILVDIRQRYRWIDEIRGHYYPVQKLMSPYELKVFYRWRVEDEAYSLSTRRDFLRTAKTLMPDFYGPLAEARLDALELEGDDVAQRFQQLAEDYPLPEEGEFDTAPKGAVYQAIHESLSQ